MKAVNVRDAQTHLSGLLARVEQGEEIVITRGGRPIAKIVGIKPAARRRPLDTARGQVVISPNFKAPLPKDIGRALGE